jgi:hypothetical protein
MTPFELAIQSLLSFLPWLVVGVSAVVLWTLVEKRLVARIRSVFRRR